MYYQVKDQIFKNKFLAASYAAKNNIPSLHFNMYETAMDQADWSKEPEQSWNELLDIRAHQIAAKNKAIVLNFSGGTDSLTIYQVFRRNNIPIDVIYMRTREGKLNDAAQKPVFDFLNSAEIDPGTKIIIRPEDHTLLTELYDSPDWIWEKGVRYQFSLAAESVISMKKILDTDNLISVIGFEKPRLVFTKTGVYSYQDDENYCRPMQHPENDCFFISPDLPELHVKQSYMLLNYIRNLNPAGKTPGDYVNYNDIHRPSHHPWLNYSILGCGRFGDLNQSHDCHLTLSNSRLHIPKNGVFHGNEFTGLGTNLFSGLRDSKAVANYTQGILNVINDPAGKFLLRDPTNFYSMRQFRSKYYKLTF
jgi:hypothetical protein